MCLLLRSYNFARTELNGTGHWFRNFMRIIVIYSQQMIIIYFKFAAKNFNLWKNPSAASDHWLGLYNNIFSKWAYSADNRVKILII